LDCGRFPHKKQIDIARYFGLTPSTVNTIAANEKEISEQKGKCGKSCKKRKTGRESAFHEPEAILLAWYLQVLTPFIPVDSNVLCEKAKQTANRMQADNFAATNG
jgi:hypothetical protein